MPIWWVNVGYRKPQKSVWNVFNPGGQWLSEDGSCSILVVYEVNFNLQASQGVVLEHHRVEHVCWPSLWKLLGLVHAPAPGFSREKDGLGSRVFEDNLVTEFSSVQVVRRNQGWVNSYGSWPSYCFRSSAIYTLDVLIWGWIVLGWFTNFAKLLGIPTVTFLCSWFPPFTPCCYHKKELSVWLLNFLICSHTTQSKVTYCKNENPL